ncbi:hypothetical protein NADRNF5_0761 [Nitrosopumilus adriaticus]|uniref:Uncharacterized protein n=1 Tax=Nitrosopumilus adriaticus TaxID=1580092 RepID=A0A0D5C298_9ARCH|nr:hypothetical protein NADRNF5_0761 [Nitrosopumilus adriaticus]
MAEADTKFELTIINTSIDTKIMPEFRIISPKKYHSIIKEL